MSDQNSNRKIPGGTRDANGIFVRTTTAPSNEADKKSDKRPKSVDELLEEGLINIQRIMESISVQTTKSTYDREVVASLKDCIQMLFEIKKKEAEIVEKLSESQLKALVKGK